MADSGSETAGRPIRLQIVAAGNGWWVETGPNPAAITTYAFVDVEEQPALLDLVDRIKQDAVQVDACWQEHDRLLSVRIAAPIGLTLELPVDRPELEAVRRARQLFICPTTPKLGLSPYLARDRSFLVELP